jgi:hypothetical protein
MPKAAFRLGSHIRDRSPPATLQQSFKVGVRQDLELFSENKALGGDFQKASLDPAGVCRRCYAPDAPVIKSSASGKASFLGFPRENPPSPKKGRAVRNPPLSFEEAPFSLSVWVDAQGRG